MSNFVDNAKLLVTLLPTVISVVKEVEAILPDQGQGAAKLGLVESILSQAYQLSQNNPAGMTFDKLWPACQGMINNLVALFNKTGVFKPAATPAATPAPVTPA